MAQIKRPKFIKRTDPPRRSGGCRRPPRSCRRDGGVCSTTLSSCSCSWRVRRGRGRGGLHVCSFEWGKRIDGVYPQSLRSAAVGRLLTRRFHSIPAFCEMYKYMHACSRQQDFSVLGRHDCRGHGGGGWEICLLSSFCCLWRQRGGERKDIRHSTSDNFVPPPCSANPRPHANVTKTFPPKSPKIRRLQF